MGDRSQIEWTDATWNPTTGCTPVSPGCDHCYAKTLAVGRLSDVYRRRLPVVQTLENEADPFAVRLWPERLGQPASWRDPRMVFVNSMSDLFHVDVPGEFVRRIFEVMMKVDRHTYQVLTKRPARMANWVRANGDLFPGGVVPSHIWLGTSVEDQAVAYRVEHLRSVLAEVRFLSCEPLIGALTLDLRGVHWLIAGGESGIGYRAMDPEWPRRLRDDCVEAGVAFFFKQWGGRTPKSNGRSLDGETWDQMPGASFALTLAL